MDEDNYRVKVLWTVNNIRNDLAILSTIEVVHDILKREKVGGVQKKIVVKERKMDELY